jgi:hypothetical protein
MKNKSGLRHDISFFNFVRERKPAAIIILLLILLFAAGSILFIIRTIHVLQKTTVSNEAPAVQLVPDQQLLLPDDRIIKETPPLTRTSNGTWTKTEAEQWFTAPDKATLDKLEKSNDKIADDITGAAP